MHSPVPILCSGTMWGTFSCPFFWAHIPSFNYPPSLLIAASLNNLPMESLLKYVKESYMAQIFYALTGPCSDLSVKVMGPTGAAKYMGARTTNTEPSSSDASTSQIFSFPHYVVRSVAVLPSPSRLNSLGSSDSEKSEAVSIARESCKVFPVYMLTTCIG